MDGELLIKRVMDCAGKVRRQLGPGYLEAVYKNAMLIELRKNNLGYEVERPISVYYDGIVVGDYKADIVVEKQLILELKAVNSLHVAHELQLVNYLTATGIDNGLLINFGSEEIQFKRKFRVYRKRFEK
ncbi:MULTISPECIES: GxxExxY protein [Prevotellaceae]|uniref:GxxExxY protein n=1 Tax=Prevotellaceae TaxID=171552 RepID=UPI0004839E11|nr:MULTISPECIES: GxxExxY protein [Prevotellaceae]UKK52323.1 GxxExxY protein [Prevotella sp. E13-17]